MNSKIMVLFERDPSADGIEVHIRAKERDENVEKLIRQISDTPAEALMITDTAGAVTKLLPSDIVTVSVKGRLLQIVTEKEQYTVRQPLHEFEEKLGSERFIRVSRYEIVNLDKIRKFDFTFGGTLRLELPGGMETWASRRSIPLIKEKLSGKEGSLC